MTRLLSLVPLLALLANPTFAASERRCALAEEATDGLNSWAKVHAAFRRYAGCDDGGVAEGYADKIEKLLADHWAQLGVLLKLSKSDPAFEAFVLRHLGEITTLPNAVIITKLAKSSCPAEGRAFCGKLVKLLDTQPSSQ